MVNSDHVRILATAHKMLYDIISVLNNPECDGKGFEIGCRCKTEEIQAQLFDTMSSALRHIDDVTVTRMEKDHIVHVERLASASSSDDE
jgi:hypothetical protein